MFSNQSKIRKKFVNFSPKNQNFSGASRPPTMPPTLVMLDGKDSWNKAGDSTHTRTPTPPTLLCNALHVLCASYWRPL